MATAARDDSPASDAGQATPTAGRPLTGPLTLRSRPKRPSSGLHRWLTRTKRKICTEGNPGHQGWGDPGSKLPDRRPAAPGRGRDQTGTGWLRASTRDSPARVARTYIRSL